MYKYSHPSVVRLVVIHNTHIANCQRATFENFTVSSLITVGNPSLLGFHSLNPVVNGFMHTITFANCLIKAVYHVSSKNSAQLLKLCQI